ncbi:molybdopterin-containing oxidoreductase family protein [Veillonella intestinalis]|uniref:molybdopterin-containing oxidoreductase family protein n=1 Tax=Veillonella intestinalis TaxID=2941341 RepID=UPI00203F31CD|nr:molybdopterin-dependent oxidoreductase [Veillonella intestinalis]
MTKREINAVCPYDCPDACGLIVTTENGRVTKVVGNPNHAFTRGMLCPKMAHYEETIHSPERLLTPLKRTGPKGSGEFTPISWDEAIQSIAQKFKESLALYGGQSIMPYSYAGTMGLIHKAAGFPLFARLGAVRHNRGICSPAKTYGWQMIMGNTFGTRPQELGHSDCVILWSLNALATDIHIMHDVKAAKARGAKVWVIDIYHTITCDQADEVVVVKPGTDGALAMGILHILERDDLVNRDFIEKHVIGYDKLVRAELGTYTPTKVAAITGVSVEQIEALAQAYGKAKAPFIRLGSGLSRYGNGAMTVRAIACLPAVVGAYETLGGGMLSDAKGSYYINDGVMSWDLHAGKVVPTVPMVKLGDILNKKEDPIRCLYIYSSNPAITAPDQNQVRRGLQREDLFTVVHERFLTDTAKYADIVLPATSSVEADDIYNSYGHYTSAIGYKAIEPIGESKSNWDTICLLAKAMGITDPFFDKTALDLIQDTLDRATHVSEADKAKLLAGEPVEMAVPANYKMNFKTSSGKIEIYNPREQAMLPTYVAPYSETVASGEYHLINAPDIRILDSSFCERVFDRTKPLMAAWIHPDEGINLGVQEGDLVELANEQGTLQMPVFFDKGVQPKTVVSYGVWWQRYSSDAQAGINALTSSRLTDFAEGSTFYDVKVDIRPVS